MHHFRRLLLFALALLLLLPALAFAADAAPPPTTGQWITLVLGFVAIIPTLFSAFTKWEKPTTLYGWVKAGLDLLSFVTHKDSPGSLSLPGIRSEPPLGTPTTQPGRRIDPSPPPSRPDGIFLVLVFAGSLLCAGVAHASGSIASDAPAKVQLEPTSAAADETNERIAAALHAHLPLPSLLMASDPAPVVVVQATAPVIPDPIASKLQALETALKQLQAQSGAPSTIPSTFWDSKPGQVLAVTLTVATMLTAAAGSAAGVYAAFK